MHVLKSHPGMPWLVSRRDFHNAPGRSTRKAAWIYKQLCFLCNQDCVLNTRQQSVVEEMVCRWWDDTKLDMFVLQLVATINTFR